MLKTTILYLVFAFIQADLNFQNWNIFLRAFGVFLWLLWILITASELDSRKESQWYNLIDISFKK